MGRRLMSDSSAGSLFLREREPCGAGSLAAGSQVVRLDREDDIAGFRNATRRLVAQGVAPDRVSWHVATSIEGDLFAGPPAEAPTEHAPPLVLPAFFASMCDRAVLHADPGRFGLLDRFAWRLLHEPTLRHDPLDADRIRLDDMTRAVRRDMHKMTAFVRFRPLAETRDDVEGRVSHVAWFEPQHHITRAIAPFFARRFAQMAWAILTPDCSVRWDGHRLAFGPGARREDAPAADAAESLWLTYYANIFNPARLKIAMMEKEMPRRYWKNLPEATLIHTLTHASAQRTGRMIEQPASDPARRRPAASIALRIDHRPPDLAPLGSPEALRAATERCRECPIGQFATQAVNGEGPIGARLMLVGEQPGDREDLQGRPFVGPAGQLLDRALAQLGWPRDTLYLTNAVKHFGFELRGKRRIHKTPAQQEAAACLHWLESEIALVGPTALVALGATAARALLGRPVAVTRERGQWLMRDDGLPVLVTLHPSALLRMEPAERDAAFEAWLADLSKAADPPPTMDAAPPLASGVTPPVVSSGTKSAAS